MTLEEIKALPAAKQIQIMMDIAGSPAINELTYVWLKDLDVVLDRLLIDATDQAAAENDALHGPEVAMLTDMWVSPCGMRVGG